MGRRLSHVQAILHSPAQTPLSISTSLHSLPSPELHPRRRTLPPGPWCLLPVRRAAVWA
uniref:Uncharacterized protein n=1 Tax=Vitis vinifera TaxID=29760 RepID=F6HCH8_VITVI